MSEAFPAEFTPENQRNVTLLYLYDNVSQCALQEYHNYKLNVAVEQLAPLLHIWEPADILTEVSRGYS
jgi:hypothetical protein